MSDGRHYLDQHGLAHLWEKIKALGATAETHTTAEWDSMPQVVSIKGKIYVYSDHQVINGINIPGFKVGDGDAYIINLPFTDAAYMDHIANQEIHVAPTDRVDWDNKVTCLVDNNILIFSK